MRTIKFRARYEGAEGGFIYTDRKVPWRGHKEEDGTCGLSLVNDIWGVSHSGSDNDWGPLEYVGQFTGLHDKNGKEIYEGDVILSIETDEVYQIDDMLPAHRHDHSTNIGYYSGKKYHTRDNPASRYTGDDWMSWPEMYEVIGNIWENPELVSLPAS